MKNSIITPNSSPSPASTSRDETTAAREKTSVGQNDENKIAINWNLPDKGRNNKTPLDKMLKFFLEDNGNNLMRYTGLKAIDKDPNTEKGAILKECCQLFQNVGGVAVTPEEIQNQIDPIIHHKYEIAYKACIASNRGEIEGTKDRKSREEYLDSICPEYSKFRNVLGSSYTGPLIQGSDIKNEKRITRKEALEEVRQSLVNYSAENSNFASPSSSDDSDPLELTTSNRKNKRIGKPINFERIVKKAKEDSGSSDHSEISVKLKDEREKCNLRTGEVMELSRREGWPANKTMERLKAIRVEIYGN